MTKAWQPKPGVAPEVRAHMAKIGSVGGKNGSRAAKQKAAKKLTKRARQLGAARSHFVRFGTPIPEGLIHGAMPKK